MNFNPENVREKAKLLIDELMEYYVGDNWLVVKKYILRYSHPNVRKSFTTRHKDTKKHALNSFEKDLIKYCDDTYNIKLKLYEEDTHYD